MLKVSQKKLYGSLSWLRKNYSTAATMKSWQILEYGGVEKLCLNESAIIPAIEQPADVLVKVNAASVNPIDNKMISGYGSEAFQQLKKIANLDLSLPEFPLTLGRDFAGSIVDPGVSSAFKFGDEVWGTVNVSRQGAFSEYIVVSSSDLSLRPPRLTSTEAASIPYVASTIYNSLAPLCRHVAPQDFQGTKVLVLGGSGGVGTFAIQFLSCCGAEVTTTVAADFVDRAAELGASNVVDYHKPDANFLIGAFGRYDLILDLVNKDDRASLLTHLRTFTSLATIPRYITINFPFFSNVQKHGVVLGACKSASQLALEVTQGIQHGALVTWGAYAPNKRVLEVVHALVQEKKLHAVVDKVYGMQDLPAAMQKVLEGHNRGKVVLNLQE